MSRSRSGRKVLTWKTLIRRIFWITLILDYSSIRKKSQLIKTCGNYIRETSLTLISIYSDY
jgi:hypothetical protein